MPAAVAAPSAAAPGEPADGWQFSSKVDQLLDRLRKENSGAIPARPGHGPLRLEQRRQSRTGCWWSVHLQYAPIAAHRTSSDWSPNGKGGSSGAGSEARKPHKVIVLSQWTSMLYLIEIPLAERGLNYRWLDGTVSVDARSRAVQDFVEKL